MCDENPKKGDRFKCEMCGMEFVLTTDCKCMDKDCKPTFTCCDQEMVCEGPK